jgi:hypothetical protein
MARGLTIAANLLVEALGAHPIEGGEFGILQDALAAQDEDGAGDLPGGNGFAHWCFPALALRVGATGSHGRHLSLAALDFQQERRPRFERGFALRPGPASPNSSGSYSIFCT